MNESIQTEIAIVGGGMVGAALALALGQAGYLVTLLETRQPALEWPGESHDLRVSALTLASCRMLADLGVWPRIQAMGACPFQQMHVWDANGSGLLHLDAADCGQPEMGFVVENRVTVAALWQSLLEHPNIKATCPAQLQNYSLTPDGVELMLDQNRSVHAKLIIGADGSRSQVRELAGIATHGWSYDQKALVATVKPSLSHQFTAWQRFLDEGPLALLPLPNGLISIVWTATAGTTEARLALSDSDFCAALDQASESILGSFEVLGPRAAFPLQLQFTHQYCAERMALVGDAIHTIHPLAGQGANLGLSDVSDLVNLLTEARQKNRDCGSQQLLRRYERARKADNLIMMGAMDALKRLYGHHNLPLQTIRSTGMQWINASSPIKNWIAHYAMGLTGNQSRFNPDQIHL